jgi:chromosome transmission fidelity protein 4
VKIIDLNETTRVWVLDGYKECVKKLSWDPSGSLLVRGDRFAQHLVLTLVQATSTADGKVVIWDMTKEDPSQVTTIEGVIPAFKDSKCVARPRGIFFGL